MVPRTVLTRSGLISLNTARPINTVQPRTTVNNAGPMKNVINNAYSTARRPFNKITTANNSNFTKKVNTVKGTRVNTARPKAVLSAVKENKGNAVKASACWVWRPKHKILDHGNPQQDLKDKGVIDSELFGPNICKELNEEDVLPSCQNEIMTSQQNRVAERKNRTLIEADRTILADSKLPTTFWAQAVNTACYVQNRVLVIKPHNKTPYKLFLGRKPALSFMRPFGCPVIILNTIDHLGKFDRKADEGFFIGYSTNSKALRVQEDLLMLGFQTMRVGGKEMSEDPGMNDGNSTNNVNAVSSTVNTVGTEVNVVDSKTSIELPNDLNMPELEDIVYSDDDENVGAEADMNNLDAFMPVSPIPTTRIHKDHPVDQIIGDLNSAPQTRRMTKNLKEHGLLSSVQQRTNHKDFQIGSMQDELLQFKLQKVWTLVDLPNGKRAIGTKWVYRNKKDERGFEEGSYVCQPSGFEDPDFPHRVYKVEKALYGLHQAPRAWYETLSTYLLENRFQRGQIDKTLFIKRDQGDILIVQYKKQIMVANSTTEAEYVAALSCCGKKGIGVNAGDSKLMLLGINLLLLEKVNVARHNLLLLVATAKVKTVNGEVQLHTLVDRKKVIISESTIRRDLQLEDAEVEDMSHHKRIYVTPSHIKKVFGNMKKEGRGFSGRVIPLFPTMMVQAQEEMGEEPIADEAANEENVPTHSNDPIISVLNLETSNTAQSQEITSLKKRVKKLEKRNRSRTHGLKRLYKVGLSSKVVSFEDEGLGEEDASKQRRKPSDAIDEDDNITLVNDAMNDDLMFDTAEEEEERLAREKAQHIEDANIAWDDIQEKIDADYQLAERLQAEEQEQLTNVEKAKLFSEIAQKSSSKRAGEELEQESSKKQKIDDEEETTEVDEDKETVEFQSLFEIVPDDADDIAIDAIPLATKPPSICLEALIEKIWKLYGNCRRRIEESTRKQSVNLEVD
ncbi:putative ribonuclease H-like domain-containing protein [Tanacetum coccineum]